MKTSVITVVVCLIFLAFSCKKENSGPAETKQIPLTLKQKEVVDKSNSFGFDFFRKVYEANAGQANLMVSPLSVSMALGMTRNGAAGSTLDAMTQTLGFSGLTEEEINQSYKYILETFTGLDPQVKLAVANSIWYRNSFSVEPSFITTDQDYFHASVSPLNFEDPGSVNTINNWVSENTNQLIPKILDEIPAEAVMYLINAVYFKGQWKYRFEKSNTLPQAFHLADGSDIQAESMSQQSDFGYYKGNGFTSVELPYNQGNYNMVILLPDAGKTIASVTAQLTRANWLSWYGNYQNQEIKLQLPKFRFSYDEKNMISILSGLGMGVAFSDFADFTRINSNGGLLISEVKHKTYIATDESGTEAAAVTSVGIGVTSTGPDEPISFTVDRPFVFFIHEKSTGTILFIGTVTDPTQN